MDRKWEGWKAGLGARDGLEIVDKALAMVAEPPKINHATALLHQQEILERAKELRRRLVDRADDRAAAE